MSYKRSRARVSFELQLDRALKEIKSLYAAALKSGGGEAPRLLAAYYVMTFSQLEVYIRSFVEDTLETVAVSNPVFDKWPDLMVAYLLHRGADLGGNYRKYGISEDEGAILEKLAETARKIAAWDRGGAVPAAIDSASVLDKKKYPSPKNLTQLFRRLGVKQIWAVVDAAGRINGRLLLTSLNDLRTDIVHEGIVPPAFGLADFRDRIGQMKRLVAAIDRGVSKEFCRGTIPRVSWNESMG